MTMPRALRLSRWTGVQARALTAIARYGADRIFTPRFDGCDHAYVKPWRILMRPHRGEETSWSASRLVGGENEQRVVSSFDNREDAQGIVSSFDNGEDVRENTSRLVSLDWNGAQLALRLSPRLCDDWLAVRLPDLELDDLPTQFIDAAWEAMIAEALKALGLERLCPGIRIVLDEIPDRRAACPYAWTLSIQSPDAARTIEAELAMDDAALQRLANVLSHLPTADTRRARSAVNALAVAVLAKVGETTLDVADLRRIQVGDVVLFDRCLATREGDVWFTTLDGQGMCARASEGASRYVVTQEWSFLMNDGSRDVSGGGDNPSFGAQRDAQSGIPTDRSSNVPSEMSMDPQSDTSFDTLFDTSFDTPADGGRHGEFVGHIDAPPEESTVGTDPWPSPAAAGHDQQASKQATTESASAESAGDGGLDVNRIPVRLGFDLGEQMLTLGDLRRLRVGEFFDLQRRIDAGPVHIRANGTLIGTAELVDIEGRIGARVLTLTLDHHSCR